MDKSIIYPSYQFDNKDLKQHDKEVYTLRVHKQQVVIGLFLRSLSLAYTKQRLEQQYVLHQLLLLAKHSKKDELHRDLPHHRHSSCVRMIARSIGKLRWLQCLDTSRSCAVWWSCNSAHVCQCVLAYIRGSSERAVGLRAWKKCKTGARS